MSVRVGELHGHCDLLRLAAAGIAQHHVGDDLGDVGLQAESLPVFDAVVTTTPKDGIRACAPVETVGTIAPIDTVVATVTVDGICAIVP